MNSDQLLEPGQRLAHAAKPEWGVGTVVKSEWASHDGKRCQRVTIRFARAGLKTVSTAFARLEAADGPARIDAARDGVKAALARDDNAGTTPRPGRKPAPGMLGPSEAPPDEGPSIDPARAREVMAGMPDAARDPFTPLRDRIAATLRLYRYAPTGGSLLDWAAAQAGVDDPLSIFSRHELEQFFDRFRINRDQHLATLVNEARKTGADVADLLAAAPDAARRAVSGSISRR